MGQSQVRPECNCHTLNILQRFEIVSSPRGSVDHSPHLVVVPCGGRVILFLTSIHGRIRTIDVVVVLYLPSTLLSLNFLRLCLHAVYR